TYSCYAHLTPPTRSLCPSFPSFSSPPTPEIYTLSLHDALPISPIRRSPRTSASGCALVESTAFTPTRARSSGSIASSSRRTPTRSEEHTSELQSHLNLVCRLLLEKKNKAKHISNKMAVSLEVDH